MNTGVQQASIYFRDKKLYDVDYFMKHHAPPPLEKFSAVIIKSIKAVQSKIDPSRPSTKPFTFGSFSQSCIRKGSYSFINVIVTFGIQNS